LPSTAEVLVVGAGISGLAAARGLVASGLDTVVLEARDRVGGRLLSVPSGGAALDLGATWFWANEPRVCALVAELGLPTHPQYLAGDALYQDARSVQRLAGNPIDVPAGRLSTGMQALAEAMADRLPTGTIRLEQPVSGLRTVEDGVEAEVPAGAVRAGHLILAVPPALALSDIAFEPGLSTELIEIASTTPVWMGGMTKVVARYSRPFWRERGLAGAAVSHTGPLREVHDMSGPDGSPAALFGFAPPDRIGAPPPEPGRLVQQLATLFGSEAAEPEELFVHDWRRERHTSPPDVEGLSSFHAFGHPAYARPIWDGRLHWAGTETAREYAGHVEGALSSGARAASAVLSNLRRSPG